MKTIIYFVRHGEVENPKDIVYGRLPGYKLSAKGRKQIEQTAQFLSTKKINHIYSSRQKRARESTQIIQEKMNVPKTILSDDLLEIKSPYEGLTFSYIHTQGFDVFTEAYQGIKGETIVEIKKRMSNFIESVSSKHPGQNIVAVSHGDPIMILRASIDRLPLIFKSLRPKDGTYIKHGEVYKVIYDNNAGTLTYESIFIPQV